MRILIGGACLLTLIVSSAVAEQCDRLIVVAEKANFRDGPSMAAHVLALFKSGHRVIELDREENWIFVRTLDASMREGWLHNSLLSVLESDMSATDQIACQPTDETGLPRARGSKLFYSGPLPFYYDRKQYQIETFSAAASKSSHSGFVCVRYEVENISSGSIPNFYWDLLYATEDIANTDMTLHPCYREARRRDIPSEYPEITPLEDTTLHAFRRSAVVSKAHHVVVDATTTGIYPPQIQAKPKGSQPKPTAIDVAADMPTTAEAIREADIQPGLVYELELTETSHELPVLYDSLRSFSGNVTVHSSARFGDGSLTVISEIDAAARGGGELRLYAPALAALDVAKSLNEYLAQVKFSLNEPIASSEGSFSTYSKSYEDIHLFVVEHPVTVVEESWTSCILVWTYSLYPVSLGKEYCAD